MKCDLRASVAGLVLLALAPVSSSHAQATPTGRPTASDYSVELYKPGYFTNFEWPTSTAAMEIGPFISIGRNELLRVREHGFGYDARFTAMRPDDASGTPLVALQTTRPPTPYGSTIVGALATDYNHDGRVEMLIASSAALEMITYDGNAAVSAYFQNLPGTLWIDSTPVAADFDRDGHMDVAFHQSHTDRTPAGTQARLVIFRGNGANDFAEEVDTTTGGPNLGDRQRAVRVTSSDFNNDGWPDVAILFRQLDAATKTESRPVKVFLNNGAGAFMPPYTLSDDSTLLQIAAGDVDNDGLADLVATSLGALHVFRQNGDGQLALAYSLPAQESSRAVEIADLDGDGRLDVVSGSSTTYRIAWYIQQRTGMLAPAKFSAPISNEIDYYRALSFNADSFTVTDLTADGCNDLLITQGEWRLRGQGCARTLYTPGDVDDDGKADLLWRHHAQRDLALWKMDGSARVLGMGYVVGSTWKVLSTGDFNGDRWMDLLWSDGHNMQLWEGDGLGRFLGSWLPEFPQGWRLVASGDFDRDGKDDLFWRNAADTDAALWRMDGAKVLETRGFATSPAWRIEGSGDFNGDGRRDLLWTDGVHMQLWRTQADLTFAGVEISDFPRGWKLSGITDVNGDGNEDLLWFLPQLGELAIWEIHGASDIRGRGYSVGRDWQIIQTGDFNADGYGDLVWSNGRNMQLWQSQGSYFQGLQMDAYPTGWSIIHR